MNRSYHNTLTRPLMKPTFLLSLAALAAGKPAFAQPMVAQVATVDPFKSIQAKLGEKKYAEAVAEVETALQGPALNAGDKLRLLKTAAQASMGLGKSGLPAATAFQERIVADPGLANTAKIEAVNSIAEAYISSLDGQELRRMDIAKAHTILNRALELPDLKPEEQVLALKNIGKLYDRQDLEAQARETYQKILVLGVSDRSKADAQRLIADTYLAEGKGEEALALYKANGWGLLPLYQRLGDTEKRDAEASKLLNDAATPENTRWITFTRLPLWDARTKDVPAMKKAWEMYMPAFLEKDPNRALFLQRAVTAADADPQFVEWAAPLLVQAPRLSAAATLEMKSALVEALAADGKPAAAGAEAATITANAEFAAPARLWARLVAAAAQPGSDAGVEAAKAVREGETLSGPDKADAILRAARTVLRGGNAGAARGLYAFHQSLLAKPARAAIAADFVATAPYDVGSWLASPLLKAATGKAKLDRPYGDNLKFLLETDAAVTGRNTTADLKEDTGDKETDFYAATDAEGIHLFFNAWDARVADVMSGLVGGGAFEMYLAPGANQAYYTFLTEMPKGGINPDDFVTMYPNAHFRTPSEKDGTLRTETRATDKGFATHLFLDWRLFYDKLPANGTKWQFDAIRWTRSGGFSFGGSESVHNRSGWGDIVFSGLTEQNLNAIKRRIVFKAVAKYREAKRPVGAIGMWADPDLADRDFYQTQVAPLVKQLDDYAALVTKDMTADDVEKLYSAAVPGWMDAEFQLDAMRTRYLESKQFLGK